METYSLFGYDCLPTLATISDAKFNKVKNIYKMSIKNTKYLKS